MLRRRVSPEGVVWYESPLLAQAGVTHAFSTRIGGVSPVPFASLNLGNPSGTSIQDSPENLRENHRQLFDAAGFDWDDRFGDAVPMDRGRSLCRVHQTHGPEVVTLRRETSHNPHAQADALVTDDPRRIISVRVADCVPVVVAAADGRVVSAVHAGWRGVVQGVAVCVVDAARKLTPDQQWVAAIGPSISRGAFEVGPEVVDAFRECFGRAVADRLIDAGTGDRSYVDLRGAIAEQLRAIGINEIDTTDRCTVRDADEFFSHRRENGVTGRMAVFVAPAR